MSKRAKVVVAAAMSVLIIAGIVIGCLAAFNRKNVNVGTDTLFHEGLVPVKFGDFWGYADTSGNIAVTPQYEYAGSFGTNGLACVGIGGKYGYIGKNGKRRYQPITITPEASAVTDSQS